MKTPDVVNQLFQAHTPVTPVRAVHLDLKGVPPTFSRLLELLEVFTAARYNAILVEWEDMFPWRVDARFGNATAYTPEQVHRFHEAAAALGLEVIPLIQCLGHIEFVLRHPGYEHLREVPDRSDVLNPLAPGAQDLIRALIDDVLALSPGIKRLHLGGDEAWTLGTHRDTRRYIEQHGKGALYLHHVQGLLDLLNGRGIRPLLWHDMMIEWDDASLDRLADSADLVVWGYGQTPDETEHHYATRYIERFAQRGLTLWGATAYKGADGCDADLPDPDARLRNAQGWADVARRYDMTGLVATAWSRYSHRDVQCEPIDAALDCLLLVGVILHDGQPPEGGVAACERAMLQLPEAACFTACRDVLREFADAQCAVARWVAQIAKRLALGQSDPSRASRALVVESARWVDGARQRVAASADRVRQVLDTRVPQQWIEEYVDVRVRAWEGLLAELEARARQVPREPVPT